MWVISVRDNENNRWGGKGKKANNKKRKKIRGGASYSESERPKWFPCTFKLGLVQLTCKASLIFKSSLELGLSITLKEIELYESKSVVTECRCLEIWDSLPFLICTSSLVLKWQQA